MKHRFLLPLIAAAAVTVLPITLITVGVFSPYTHANLTPYYDPGYTRTLQTEVGPPLLYRSHGIVEAADATTPIEERGRALLAARGCAGCHGISGQGGAVAPALVPDLEVLRQYVRTGTTRMPIFSPQEVTDYDLAAIAAYLKSASQRTQER